MSYWKQVLESSTGTPIGIPAGLTKLGFTVTVFVHSSPGDFALCLAYLDPSLCLVHCVAIHGFGCMKFMDAMWTFMDMHGYANHQQISMEFMHIHEFHEIDGYPQKWIPWVVNIIDIHGHAWNIHPWISWNATTKTTAQLAGS